MIFAWKVFSTCLTKS